MKVAVPDAGEPAGGRAEPAVGHLHVQAPEDWRERVPQRPFGLFHLRGRGEQRLPLAVPVVSDGLRCPRRVVQVRRQRRRRVGAFLVIASAATVAIVAATVVVIVGRRGHQGRAYWRQLALDGARSGECQHPVGVACRRVRAWPATIVIIVLLVRPKGGF